MIISHDRRFLTNLSRSTAWLDRGKIRQIDRGFASFEAWRDEVLAEEERDQHKLDRKIVDEEHWLRYGVSGRRKRNVKRLGNLHALRDQRRNYRGTAGNASLAASEAEQSGKLVIEAKSITKAYGERKIVDNFSTRIQRGDRLGIIGPNGAGKTTLINLLTGGSAAGLRHRAAWRQSRDGHARPASRKSRSQVDAGRGADRRPRRPDHGRRQAEACRRLHEGLPVRPGTARTPLEVLSGGERGRLMLARALAKPSNLLVLDEPTNDLDLETLDVLEEMLGDYEGTVILISHDRDFLDRIVTLGDRARGQRKWTRICRRLQRHADPARRRREARDGKGARRPREERGAVRGSAPPRPSEAELQRAARAGNAAEDHRQTLQADIAKLQRLLDDPNLLRKDRKRFDQTSAAIAKAQEELSEAEERWLELEMLREEIEQA